MRTKATTAKPTSTDTRPDSCAFPFLGLLDCRTEAEREADEKAGRTWEMIVQEEMAKTPLRVRRITVTY